LIPLSVSAADQPRRPNILLLFADQHRADVLGCAGHPDVKTPNLDRLAAAGVRFDRAYCQNGICVPSRVSMITGQYCRTTGILYNRRDRWEHLAKHPALHHVLKGNGYFTACIGKRHLVPGLEEGFDYSCTTISPTQDPSDENYRDWITARGQLWSHERDFQGCMKVPLMCHVSQTEPQNRTTAYVAAKTIEAIKRARKAGKPFFCWSSFIYPHQPYTPTPKWACAYDPDRIAKPQSLHEPVENLPTYLQGWRTKEGLPWCGAWAARDESIYRRYIAYYYALVSEVDEQIGVILKALEAEGLANNTIVVYAADHGDFAGGHGMWEKCSLGHNVYEETLRVPLIVRIPGTAARGAVGNDLVELVDLYPTILDLVGIQPPADLELPGRSLVPALRESKPVGRTVAISENWSQVTVITDRYKLGVWIEAPEKRFDFRARNKDMLFDRRTDPHETTNRIDDPDMNEVERQLRAHLAQWTARTPDEGKQAVAPQAFPFLKKK
jgi:arylsulfatase A-like enzyme